MAFITAIDVKAIRTELKAKFPKFKFAVRKSNSLAVDVVVLSGPARFDDCFRSGDRATSINQYHLDQYPTSKPMLTEMIDIMKEAPSRNGGRVWFDDSDAQTDYFHTAYYMHLSIGDWCRPYKTV